MLSLFRAGDLISILIAIGSLAGNVSSSASSSSSLICAVAGRTDFCGFFETSMIGAIFGFRPYSSSKAFGNLKRWRSFGRGSNSFLLPEPIHLNLAA